MYSAANQCGVFYNCTDFFGEEQLIDYNFYKYQAEREEVVRQILLGNLQPDNSGDINLPEELQNEEMARGGYVCCVTYLSRKGIYFCTFSGFDLNKTNSDLELLPSVYKPCVPLYTEGRKEN